MKTGYFAAFRPLFLAALTVFASGAIAQERLICRLASIGQASEIAANYGITLEDQTAPAPFALYILPPGVTGDFMQALMQNDARVVWAEDDGELEAPENQSGKGSVGHVIAERQYLYAENHDFLQQIRWIAPRLQGIRPVRLAILDTGLSPQVPRLWNRAVASINAVPDGGPPYDIPADLDSNGNGFADDGVGHGTMVTGIIDMLAPNVDLVIARVADSDGMATSWSIIKGLAFAVVQGAEVANVSLGAIDRLPALSDVLDWTDDNGLLVIAAAGNINAGEVYFPAGYSKTICVTGVNPNDTKALFSNYGGDADMAAPATGIRSTWWTGVDAVWSGTSFAAPMVSATVADVLRRMNRPVLSKLRDQVRKGGNNIDPLNPNYHGKLGLRLNVDLMESALRNRHRYDVAR